MTQQQITDNLDNLLNVLPKAIREAIIAVNHSTDLLEIIMDLGRVPTARLTTGEVNLLEQEVTREQIDAVVAGLGDFDTDNRAGMERTLHRISAIRNRKGIIVGLTCRVGRAVYGVIDILEDIINEGKSVLILGRPGVGKTTLLREAARTLSEQKRVVIVDTSNEIGGDGDVPHPAIGRARRMQVATPSLQHEVMIEAVENHNPEVIVIDEIGREMEARAARTIAERGVQLIGTAHGNELENLLLNPTLSDLVGGIESVTLSDDEARRRGTQKTVLERRSSPTFDVLIEIQTRDKLAVHTDVAEAVDALLRDVAMVPEIRERGENGEIHIQRPPARKSTAGRISHGTQGYRRQRDSGASGKSGKRSPAQGPQGAQFVKPGFEDRAQHDEDTARRISRHQAVKIFPFGVARNRLENAGKRLGVPINIIRDAGDADVLVTLRAHYRKRQKTVVDAEHRGTPVYVLRANTVSQMERFLAGVFDLQVGHGDIDEEDAIEATQEAIQSVLNGERWMEMPPASSYIRRLQHQLASEARLVSHSYGKEPNRRVRIFRE